MKFWPLTTLIFVPFLAAASCQTAGTEPCDILVELNPKPETNRYIVANDRRFAVGIARHRGRYAKAGCK
jgi:hypothetical protein